MFVVDAHLLLICHTLHFMLLLLLLSLDAHSHVDDYSSTLGGVRKTKQKAKSPQIVTLSQVPSETNTKKTS